MASQDYHDLRFSKLSHDDSGPVCLTKRLNSSDAGVAAHPM